MGEKQIIVVFRYDDYSAVSPTGLEVRLLRSFQKYNIQCTFSVIPFIDENISLSQEKAFILRNALETGTVEVALHGCTHHEALRKGHFTEFNGVDCEIQEEKITRGKLYLEDLLQRKITTFVPPWNSYDVNTLHVLEKAEIEVISSGTHGPTHEHSNLKFLPATCDLLQVREAVEAARKLPERQSVVVVLFHAYDFSEADKIKGRIFYEDFAGQLVWLTSQKDVRIKSVNQAAQLIEDLGVRRFERIKTYLRSCSFLPEYIFPAPCLTYASSDNVANLIIRNYKIIALYCLALFVISAAAAYSAAHLIIPQKNNVLSPLLYILIAILTLSSLHVIRNYLHHFNVWDALDYRIAGFLFVLSGICVGIGIAI